MSIKAPSEAKVAAVRSATMKMEEQLRKDDSSSHIVDSYNYEHPDGTFVVVTLVVTVQGN